MLYFPYHTTYKFLTQLIYKTLTIFNSNNIHSNDITLTLIMLILSNIFYLFCRYFTCRPLHGLFAPLHKVSRGSGVVTSTPRRTSLAKMSRERSGSNDSLSSISSATSSISRSRVRLGVTAIANQVHAALDHHLWAP